jgi:hypothetical protein
LPPPLQKEVHATVVQTRERSGWPAKRTLGALGIARRSYYRWLKEEKWAQALPAAPVKPVQPYEALPEEKQTVLDYALKHPELRHRELAWRMVDEDVVCLSPSTVYRILKEAKLVCPASADEAAARGGRKGAAAQSALGHGPDVLVGEWAALLLHRVHR